MGTIHCVHQAYTDLAIYVVNSMLEYPNAFPREYGPRLHKICEDYDKDDVWDAHEETWAMTFVVAHGLPLNPETLIQLQNSLRVYSDVFQAGYEL